MERFPHWAERLKSGDKVKATLRHQTDGSKNKFNVEVIVISVNKNAREILAHTDYGTKKIDFCELKQPQSDISETDGFKGFM